VPYNIISHLLIAAAVSNAELPEPNRLVRLLRYEFQVLAAKRAARHAFFVQDDLNTKIVRSDLM